MLASGAGPRRLWFAGRSSAKRQAGYAVERENLGNVAADHGEVMGSAALTHPTACYVNRTNQDIFGEAILSGKCVFTSHKVSDLTKPNVNLGFNLCSKPSARSRS